MDEILVALGVAVMFFIRVGVPVLALIVIGVLVDRWQSKRESNIDR